MAEFQLSPKELGQKNKFQNIAALTFWQALTIQEIRAQNVSFVGRDYPFFNTGKNLKILLYLNELIFKLLEKENKQDRYLNL